MLWLLILVPLVLAASGSSSGDATRAGAAAGGSASIPLVWRQFTATAGDYRRAGVAIPPNPLAFDVGPFASTNARQRSELPDDALVWWSDKYGTERIYYDPGTGPGRTLDEWGRDVMGSGFNPGDVLEGFKGLVRDVTSSPLWNLVQTGAAFVPGIGTAVSVGMACAYAYGHDLALRDAAIGAARAAVPGGAAGQAAFDVGVALAEGETPSRAVLDAARAQVPAAARPAFDAGVDVMRGRSVPDAARAHAEDAAADYLAGR